MKIMKELIINIPEDAVEFVEEFVQRIGGNVVEADGELKKKQKKRGNEAAPKLSDMFGSWPDIDLDPKTYRKKLWRRREIDL